MYNDRVTHMFADQNMPTGIARSEAGHQAGSHMLLRPEATCKKLLEDHLIFFLIKAQLN